MRIELDLPDWVDERNIRVKADENNDVQILAGIELVAVKNHAHDYWRVKVGRCNMCGDCCTGLTNHIYPTVNGDCIHLAPPDASGKRLCKLALYRSRICDNDPRPGEYPRCSITYKIVKCE